MSIKTVLAVIPAKGASTRLPRKNILSLGGKPLLAWTIDAAIDAGVFDTIIVSSEDDEILDYAKQWPIMAQRRPLQLAVDPAGCIHVAQHVLSEMESVGKSFDYVAILMPTCPFRSAADIREAIALACQESSGCVVSVSEFSHTPYNALIIGENNNLTPLISGSFGRKTQELPVAYRPNGALFIMASSSIKEANSLFVKPMHPYIMPPERSIDIDNAIDLRWAEFLLGGEAL